MAKITCDTIRDLIPLVLDGAASGSSAVLVREHCQTCAECASLMGNAEPAPAPDAEKGLRRFKKQLIFGAIPILLLGILGGVMLMDDFEMFYNFILFPAVGLAAYFLLKKWCWLAPAVTFAGIFLRYCFTTEGLLTGIYSGLLYGAICVTFVGIGLLIGLLLHWGFHTLKKGKRMWLKLSAIALALVLILFCCNATFSFTGNPIVMLMAQSLAKDHLAETYPHQEFTITRTAYNFKFASYYVDVAAVNSPDTAFSIVTKNGMEVSYDTYENEVIKRGSMFARLCEEYQAIVDPIVATVPGMERHTCYFIWNPTEAEYEAYDYTAFLLDAPLTPELLHRMGGELLVRTRMDGEVTPQRAAELLKQTHEALAAAGWGSPTYSGSFESLESKSYIHTPTYTGEELDALTLEALAEQIRQENAGDT